MLSLQMYTLRHSMNTLEDYEATLRRVAEMGYRSVQITPPAFCPARETAPILRKYGLTADSAICPVYRIPAEIDTVAADARALGTDVVRTDSIRHEDRTSADGYRSFAAHLERCGKLLADRGLKFMYHFHSFEFIQLGATRGIDILLAETDPAHVLFQPDVFWLTAAGCEPSEALSMFAGRAEYIHLKDYVIVPSDTAVLEETKRASAPVGTGNLSMDKIIAAAKRMGIRNFVVEDDMGVLDPFESARQSFLNMQKYIV